MESILQKCFPRSAGGFAPGRINTVVTRREKRGRGYAGMLVGTLCQKLLAEGVRPMLYADAAYPSSNRAYQKIGFTKTGEVTEYAFRRR